MRIRPALLLVGALLLAPPFVLAQHEAHPRRTMRPFGSDAELVQYLAALDRARPSRQFAGSAPCADTASSSHAGKRVVITGRDRERRDLCARRLHDRARRRRGGLRHFTTSHLRSNDYYSSRNYAARLVGGKLVFYTPLLLRAGADMLASLPALREWRPGAEGGFERPCSWCPGRAARSRRWACPTRWTGSR